MTERKLVDARFRTRAQIERMHVEQGHEILPEINRTFCLDCDGWIWWARWDTFTRRLIRWRRRRRAGRAERKMAR